MSMIKRIDEHAVVGRGYFKYESNGRKGYRLALSPRKWVEHWSNPSADGKTATSGDLWVSNSLLTEAVRKLVEEVATIQDSPWSSAEKKIILKDDTHNNRVKLFNRIIEEGLKATKTA